MAGLWRRVRTLTVSLGKGVEGIFGISFSLPVDVSSLINAPKILIVKRKIK
jgi:hypothetical protein